MEMQFNEVGFTIIKDFFDKQLIEEVKEAIVTFDKWDLLRKKDVVYEGDEAERNYKYIQNINYYVPACHKLLASRLFDKVSELLEEEIYFVNMEIHNKVPKQGTFTPAHQDNFYFQLSPPSSLTAYIPLEMHNAQVNGGLKFLKGTNNLGLSIISTQLLKLFQVCLNWKILKIMKNTIQIWMPGILSFIMRIPCITQMTINLSTTEDHSH